MKKKRIIISVVLVIAVVVVSFFGGTKYIQYKAQKEGELISLGFQQTALEITQTGKIPIITNNTIQWFPISNFCGVQNGWLYEGTVRFFAGTNK